MSKKKIIILAAAAVFIVLVLLAIVLQDRAKGVVLGVIFIVVFVAFFIGLTSLINFINDRFLLQPRKPTHLCQHCYSLYQDPEETLCEYCFSEFGLQKELSPLVDFLEENSTEKLKDLQLELEKNLKVARGRNILFIEHDLKNLHRITKMKDS